MGQGAMTSMVTLVEQRSIFKLQILGCRRGSESPLSARIESMTYEDRPKTFEQFCNAFSNEGSFGPSIFSAGMAPIAGWLCAPRDDLRVRRAPSENSK